MTPRLFVCALVAALAAALPAHAQEDQDDASDPALPDIAPREVEIRGELQLSLPTLERQPLTELAPPPELPDIAASQQPSVQPDPQPVLNIRPDSVQLEAPESEGFSLSDVSINNALVEVLGGRYLSRRTRGHAMVPLSTYETVQARLNYEGSAGHEPFEESEANSGFDTAEGALSLSSRRLGLNTRLAAEGFYTSYNLYGAALGPDAQAVVAQPERTGLGGAFRLSLSPLPSSPVRGRAAVSYRGAQYATAIFDEQFRQDPAAEERLERRLSTEVGLHLPIQGEEAYADATWATSTIDADQRLQLLDAGGGARFGLGSDLTVQLGGRVMTYEATQQDTSSAVHAAYEFGLQARLSDHARIFLENEPGLVQHALSSLFRRNPFLVNEPMLQPSVKTFDTNAGVHFFFGPVQLKLQGGFENYPNLLFFEQAAAQDAYGYSQGFTEVHYEPAQIFRGSGILTALLSDRFHATLDATVLNGYLDNEDASIPYLPSFIGEASATYSFFEERGFASVTATYTSERSVSRQSDATVPAFVDLDVEARYHLNPQLALSAYVGNSGPGTVEEWYHYPRPPLVVMLGAQWHW